MKKPNLLIGLSALSVAIWMGASALTLRPISDNSFTLSATVPTDVRLGATDAELAEFAWQEFVALNWQSSFNANGVSSPTNQERGVPNPNWSVSSGSVNLAVWETYLHRTELIQKAGLDSTHFSKGKPQYNNYQQSSSVVDSLMLLSSSNPVYWNVLDEDNEIGSCFLFYVHGGDTVEVLYQAKANIAEYEYLKSRFSTPQDQIAAKKVVNSINADSVLTAYTANGLNCAQDTSDIVPKKREDVLASFKNSICFPCSEGDVQGAIEIKTAWRPLMPGDTASQFISREVIYFEADASGKQKTAVTTMVLIGMHIIHKTRNYPSLIFASWEHKSVRQGDDYIFISSNIYDGGKGAEHAVLPRIPGAIPQVYQTANTNVHDAIRSANTNSTWLNYDLIGVQAFPIDYYTYLQDPDQYPSYFLANYVIESDSALTAFHGSFGVPFDASITNVVSNGRSVNMGGCQGCHGQAALAGSDFSFLPGVATTKPDIQQSYSEAKMAASH